MTQAEFDAAINVPVLQEAQPVFMAAYNPPTSSRPRALPWAQIIQIIMSVISGCVPAPAAHSAKKRPFLTRLQVGIRAYEVTGDEEHAAAIVDGCMAVINANDEVKLAAILTALPPMPA